LLMTTMMIENSVIVGDCSNPVEKKSGCREA
jgi:hypothetical protein